MSGGDKGWFKRNTGKNRPLTRNNNNNIIVIIIIIVGCLVLGHKGL